MFYVYLKDVVSILLPFFLINLFLQYFYHTNLFSVTNWWLKHFFKVEYKGGMVVGFLFLLFTLWIILGSIIQTISLSFYSDTHKMIYAGNPSENISLLYYAGKIEEPPVHYHNLEVPTGSFNYIYRMIQFSKDKGTERLGAPSANYSVKNILFLTCILLALSPIFLVVIHAFAYPAIINADLQGYNVDKMKVAFDAVYQPYSITPVHMLIFSIVMFISLFFVSGDNKNEELQPPNFTPNHVIELPKKVQANAELNALPVHSFREIIDSMDNNYDSDTGFRTIVFKFENGFQIPTYVSYKYDSKKYPTLENLSLSNIKHATPMRVKVLDDLSIEPIINRGNANNNKQSE